MVQQPAISDKHKQQEESKTTALVYIIVSAAASGIFNRNADPTSVAMPAKAGPVKSSY